MRYVALFLFALLTVPAFAAQVTVVAVGNVSCVQDLTHTPFRRVFFFSTDATSAQVDPTWTTQAVDPSCTGVMTIVLPNDPAASAPLAGVPTMIAPITTPAVVN